MSKPTLSHTKTALLGLQHMFAMFGATILVPLLSGLDVSVTLISVGIGTLIFHLMTKGRIPAFLGSSFAFLVGIQLITDPENGLFAGTNLTQSEKLAYATGAILVSSIVYLLVAILVKLMGPGKFMKMLPPVVTSPTVILIGIMLAPFAINQSANNLFLALTTLVLVIGSSVWGKGMVKIVSILIGIGGAYIVALIMHSLGMTNANGSAILDFSASAEAAIVGLPPFMLPRFNVMAIVLMLPFALATVAEHVGDIVALSAITGEDFIKDPGLTRTLLGDGLASAFSGLIGGPASITYGENVGVVALTKVTNPRVVQVAAVYTALLGFSPLVATVIRTVPAAIIGGASFMLYGMIAAVGIRNLVEAKVDISKTKNLTVIAVMMVTGLGLRFANPIVFSVGGTNVPIDRLGIAIAVVVGVFLNWILPEED